MTMFPPLRAYSEHKIHEIVCYSFEYSMNSCAKILA